MVGVHRTCEDDLGVQAASPYQQRCARLRALFVADLFRKHCACLRISGFVSWYCYKFNKRQCLQNGNRDLRPVSGVNRSKVCVELQVVASSQD